MDLNQDIQIFLDELLQLTKELKVPGHKAKGKFQLFIIVDPTYLYLSSDGASIL